MIIRHILLLTLLAGAAVGQEQPVELTELNWPRKYEDKGDQMVVYDPQVESWENHVLLKASSAIVVTAAGQKEEAFGIMDYEVQTETQPEESQRRRHCPDLRGRRPAGHHEQRDGGRGEPHDRHEPEGEDANEKARSQSADGGCMIAHDSEALSHRRVP